MSQPMRPFRAQCRHGIGFYSSIKEAIETVNSHNFSCQSNIQIIEQRTGRVVYTSDGKTAVSEHKTWLMDQYHL